MDLNIPKCTKVEPNRPNQIKEDQNEQKWYEIDSLMKYAQKIK